MENDLQKQVYDLQYISERLRSTYYFHSGNVCHCMAEFELYKYGELVRRWTENAESGLHGSDPLEGQKEPALALQSSISAFNMQQQISKSLDKKSS
jgi:hypothetical protein